MPTREEKIAFIQSKLAQSEGTQVASSRQEKMDFIAKKMSELPETPENSEILEAALRVGNAIDSYTGAPTRAAIGELQNKGFSPTDLLNPNKMKVAADAFVQQFGEDPELAPTGKQIAKKAGVPDTALSDVMPGLFTEDDAEAEQLFKFKKGGAADLTASGVAGFGVDVLADPTNVIPVGAVARGTTKVVGAGVKGTAKAGARAASHLPGAKTVGTVLDVTKEGAKNTAEALKTMFTPKIAEDYKDLSRIAQDNGIDPKLLPESIEFGQDSFIARAARNRAEGVVGEPHLKKFNQALDAVRDAAENKIAKIGGGNVLSPVEAGDVIRKGFDDGVDNFFSQVGMTHNKVMEAIPNLQVSPQGLEKINSKLSGLEKWAKGESVRGITNADRARGEQILRAIEAVKAGNGSYKQTYEALERIGKTAFKTENVLADIPPDIKKFRDLYGTINEALIDTVRQAAGSPVADELLESNKMISEFLGDKSVISSIIGNKNMSPEKVFASLVEHGDTRKIEALKKILPPEVFRSLKGSFLASQIRKNADDTFSFKGFHNNLRNKKNVLGSLLDANEINELNDVIRLGSRFGEPVLSTSGTGASSLFSNITQGIRSGLESDTVIGVLKDTARKRANKASEAVNASKQLPPPKTPSGPAAAAGSAIRKNLQIVARVSPVASRILAQYTEKDSGEPKGETAWAVNGAAKLLEGGTDPKVIDQLFSSAKGKKLLIEASDLTAGSKGMQGILNQIKSQFKGGV